MIGMGNINDVQLAYRVDEVDIAPPHIGRADYRDFMWSLTSGSVDLVLTDPPYTISKKTGFTSVVNGVPRFAVSMDFGAWDHVQIDLDDMASAFYRALRQGGTAIVWYDIWKLGELKEAMENAGFKMLRQIIWQKTNPVPLNMKSTYLSNSREMAIAGVKGGKPTFHSEYDNSIYQYPIPRHNGHRTHPTQKPLQLFCDLIQKHSNKGDCVVDPFLGGGTTAVAAVQNGRRFAGCDIDTQYVTISRERVGLTAETTEKPRPRFRAGSKADLFLQLAQPDELGFSRRVSVDEFVGDYEKLKFGNSSDWVRKDSPLAKQYNIRRYPTGRGRITHIELQGYCKEEGWIDKRN